MKYIITIFILGFICLFWNLQLDDYQRQEQSYDWGRACIDAGGIPNEMVGCLAKDAFINYKK